MWLLMLLIVATVVATDASFLAVACCGSAVTVVGGIIDSCRFIVSIF